KILHTHGHFDHISATEALLAGLDAPVPVLAHPADGYLYTQEARRWGEQFGYPLPDLLTFPDGTITDGMLVEVGTLRLRVIATPGHTPGSICLLHEPKGESDAVEAVKAREYFRAIRSFGAASGGPICPVETRTPSTRAS